MLGLAGGGHAAYALENSFSAWVWSLIGDPNHPKGMGHDKYNPNGKRASQEENKSATYLSTLTIEDWEKLVEEFNQKQQNENN